GRASGRVVKAGAGLKSTTIAATAGARGRGAGIVRGIKRRLGRRGIRGLGGGRLRGDRGRSRGLRGGVHRRRIGGPARGGGRAAGGAVLVRIGRGARGHLVAPHHRGPAAARPAMTTAAEEAGGRGQRGEKDDLVHRVNLISGGVGSVASAEDLRTGAGAPAT